MTVRLKVYDEDYNVVDTVDFVDNLTLRGVAPYRNFNGRVGLTRLSSDRYDGQLVLCYFYPRHQELSYAEFISEEDAYNLCAKRNKLELVHELGISLVPEREVL